MAKYYVAKPSMICGSMVVHGSDIHVGCFSLREQNFQICSLNFEDKTQALCKTYTLDWDSFTEEDQVEVKFSGKMDMEGDMAFALVLRPKDQQSEKRVKSFYLFEEGSASKIEVPLRNVNIREVEVFSVNLAANTIHLLMSIQNGRGLDLVTFKLLDFVIDKESLEHGLMKQSVMHYIIDENNITTFTIDKVTNQLTITQMNVQTLKNTPYVIENQFELIEVLYNNVMILVTSRNTKYMVQSHLIDLENNRIFFWDDIPRTENSISRLLNFNNRRYLWTFHFNEKKSKSDCKLVKIEDFYSILLSFDETFGKTAITAKEKSKPQRRALEKAEDESLDKYRTVNEGYDVILANVHFMIQRNRVASISITFVPQKYMFNKFRETSVQARIYGNSSLYLMLFGNNLELNPQDPNIIYFNQAKISMTEFKNVLKHEDILICYKFLYTNYLTKSGKLFYVGYQVTNLKEEIPYRLIEWANFDFPDWLKRYSSEKISYDILYENYAILSFDKRKFYVTNLYRITFQGGEQNKNVNRELDDLEASGAFTRLMIPKNKICEVMKTILYCFNDVQKMEELGIMQDEDDEDKGRVIFNLMLLSGELVIEEVYTFIPDMESLLGPLSFYASSFSHGSFTMLQKGDTGYEILHAGDKGIEIVVPITFIKDAFRSHVYFAQLMVGYQLIVIHKDSIEVWVTNYFRVMRFPDKEYLVDFKEYLFTQVIENSGIFLIVYRTQSNKIRGLLYKIDEKPFYRLIKEFEISDRPCEAYNIKIMARLMGRETYISYFCNGLEKVLHMWKYSGINEINLLLTRDQIYYRVQIGSKIEQNVTLKNLNYYKQFTIKTKELVLPEEETNYQVYDLEMNSILITKGDVIGIRQTGENPYVTFMQRINKLKHLDLIHKHELNMTYDYQIKRSDRSVPVNVTDEFVMRGNDIQNNIFYHNCKNIRARVYTEDHPEFQNTFLCVEQGTSQYFITDFLEIKVGIAIDRKEVHRPYLLKVGNFLFLFVQTFGSAGVTMYKFTFNEYLRDTLRPIYKGQIRISDFSTSLHDMDFFFAFYHRGEDQIFLIIKEMHATSMSIRSVSVNDNYIDYTNVQWLTFKDGTKKKLYFTYCTAYEDDIICSGRSAKKMYVIKIFLDIEWRVKILYKMDPHYTFNNMSLTPTSLLVDEYMAVILTTKNVFDIMDGSGDSKKWPLITIYKMNKDTKKGDIYGVLFWEDFRDENIKGQFHLKDIVLVKGPTGQVRLYVSSIAAFGNNTEAINLFRVYEFEISTFRLKYDLSSLRFRDSLELIGFDYDTNTERVVIPILIKTNQKIFMYMIFNVCLILIFTILVIVISYFYAQNKAHRSDQMASEESMESHDINAHYETDDNSWEKGEESEASGEGPAEGEAKDQGEGEQKVGSPEEGSRKDVLQNSMRVDAVMADQSN